MPGCRQRRFSLWGSVRRGPTRPSRACVDAGVNLRLSCAEWFPRGGRVERKAWIERRLWRLRYRACEECGRCPSQIAGLALCGVEGGPATRGSRHRHYPASPAVTMAPSNVAGKTRRLGGQLTGDLGADARVRKPRQAGAGGILKAHRQAVPRYGRRCGCEWLQCNHSAYCVSAGRRGGKTPVSGKVSRGGTRLSIGGRRFNPSGQGKVPETRLAQSSLTTGW